MKKYSFIILLFIVIAVNAQKPQILKFNDLKSLIQTKTDTIYVISFWATWCDPCVRELPSFLQLESELKDQKVKFHFISLDFVRDYDSQFLPFVEKKFMNSSVYLLDEPDYNSWIDKIDPHWLGSIPATIVISHHPDSTYFNEGEMSFESLSKLVKSLIH